VVILYGSLFDFGFYWNHDPRGPLGVLLASGFRPAARSDVVANILLYLPLGFFAVYALEGRRPLGAGRSPLAAWAASAAAGFTLSLFVELVQFYDMGRVQALSDVYSNTLGALLGAAAATAVRRRVSILYLPPYLILILFCWLASRWCPAAPPIPANPARDAFHFFAAWLAVGLMLESLSSSARSRAVLPALLAASLVVRALTVDVEPAEIVGGASAALLWSALLWRLPSRAPIAAALFVILVAQLALEPFQFSATSRAFGWVPFRSLLEAATDAAIRAFFDKAFLYGGMLWLLVRAGCSSGAAAAFGATLVFGLRLLQIYLPGRSAEITDTILVLMLAAVMKLASLAAGAAAPDRP